MHLQGFTFRGRCEYIVVKVLGQGGFGSVFKVTADGDGFYAMKVEKKIDTRRHSKLKMEVNILKALGTWRREREAKLSEEERKTYRNHFTDIFDRGKYDQFFYMVIDLVGKSLGDLKLTRPDKVFSLGTGLGCAIQCLEAIRDLHDIQYIHRDIKPANYACGLDSKSHTIYILDFGISRRLAKDSGEIKTPRERVGFKGTIRFASVACHRNQELGKKDDVECWLYLVMDILVKPGLPWRKESEKVLVGNMKESIKDPNSQVHKEFYGDLKCKEKLHKIFMYLQSLQYVDVPDYEYIYKQLKDAARECHVDPDAPFDWELQRKEKSKMISLVAPNAAAT